MSENDPRFSATTIVPVGCQTSGERQQQISDQHIFLVCWLVDKCVFFAFGGKGPQL
jgi:hypothetical protein